MGNKFIQLLLRLIPKKTKAEGKSILICKSGCSGQLRLILCRIVIKTIYRKDLARHQSSLIHILICLHLIIHLKPRIRVVVDRSVVTPVPPGILKRIRSGFISIVLLVQNIMSAFHAAKQQTVNFRIVLHTIQGHGGSLAVFRICREAGRIDKIAAPAGYAFIIPIAVEKHRRFIRHIRRQIVQVRGTGIYDCRGSVNKVIIQ